MIRKRSSTRTKLSISAAPEATSSSYRCGDRRNRPSSSCTRPHDAGAMCVSACACGHLESNEGCHNTPLPYTHARPRAARPHDAGAMCVSACACGHLESNEGCHITPLPYTYTHTHTQPPPLAQPPHPPHAHGPTRTCISRFSSRLLRTGKTFRSAFSMPSRISTWPFFAARTAH
jgi:hypothetical protein